MDRRLNRMSITGPIHEHIPLCVITEIADAHGINHHSTDHTSPNFTHHLVQKIYDVKPPIAPDAVDIKDLTDWQRIARFVNKSCRWPQSKLIQAYNFLIQFTGPDDPLNHIPDIFEVGLQTPDNPHKINACVLYKICIYHRLRIHSLTTLSQMGSAVRMLRESVGSIQRRVQLFLDHHADRTDLINTLLLSPHPISDPQPEERTVTINVRSTPSHQISYEMLDRMYESINDVSTLQQKIEPTTDHGAISLAAINYGIDLSWADEPLPEYRGIKLSGIAQYQPADPWMRHWYERIPSMFNLRITFNPVFPKEYYSDRVLNTMVRQAGFTDIEIENASPYELLQLSYVTDNFHPGLRPNLRSYETIINLDPVDEVPSDELICYGQLNSLLQPTTFAELIDLFQVNQNFTNPFTNGVFSPLNINRLKILARQANVMTLVETINMIESSYINNDAATRDFRFMYRSVDADTKNAIVRALNLLLESGLYMRGWEGPGNDYPINRAPRQYQRENETAVHVTMALAEYESACRSLGRIGNQINDLPLVRWRDGEYQSSTSVGEGLTIKDRIQIVRGGENISNMASCIRMTSNWICASAHKYLVTIGQDSPFDIFHLSRIA